MEAIVALHVALNVADRHGAVDGLVVGHDGLDLGRSDAVQGAGGEFRLKCLARKDDLLERFSVIGGISTRRLSII